MSKNFPIIKWLCCIFSLSTSLFPTFWWKIISSILSKEVHWKLNFVKFHLIGFLRDYLICSFNWKFVLLITLIFFIVSIHSFSRILINGIRYCFNFSLYANFSSNARFDLSSVFLLFFMIAQKLQLLKLYHQKPSPLCNLLSFNQ